MKGCPASRRSYGPKPKLLGREQEVVDLFVSGKTTPEIAEIFGVHFNTVIRLLHQRLGPILPGKGGSFRFVDLHDKVIADYKTGKYTYRSLAEKYGCGKTTIQWIVCNSTKKMSKKDRKAVARMKHALVREKGGYIVCYRNGRYDSEHRHLALELLGRRLADDELVHHVDGTRSCNVAENLGVCANHKDHTALHAEVYRLMAQHDPSLMRRLNRQAAENLGIDVIWLADHA